MAGYNSSQNILKEIQTDEACQIAPAPSASSLGIDSNFEELPQYMNTTESYALTEVKREPCQVSEVTTSAVPEIQLPSSRHKTTLNTSGVKIESMSPKQPEVADILQIKTNAVTNGVMGGWSQEPLIDVPISQSPKEINYFGIRVADLATSGCGNIYLAGANFVSAESTEDANPGIHTTNRPSSTFWQYPNSFPVEPVLSMSPVGLQYSRDSSRGQLVLLPTTATMDPFPQATFMWPTYIPQTTGSTLSTSQNIIFPSISSQPNSQSLSYAPHIQFIGTNYLTTAASTTASTFCQHSQINRFVSISSDIKRLDQAEKENDMKIEECGKEYNNLRMSGELTGTNATKSKPESDPNCIQHTNGGFECSIPILPSETSHNVFESSTNSSEFFNLPICISNLTQSTNPNGRLQITQDVPHSPEMQDVIIQTDTAVNSEDEIFLEVATVDANLCREYLGEKNNNGLSTNFHNNFLESADILKQSSQEQTIGTLKACHLDQLETKSVDSELTASMKSKKSFDNFRSNNPNSRLSLDCTSFNETIRSVPEMSGLELLSNISTGSFDNHNTLKNVYIKTEPYEIPNENVETYYCNAENSNFEATASAGKNNIPNSLPPSNNQLPLGGLNLLCALAEQRILEEVECNNHTEITNEITCDTKRRKCKHAKLKSRKKSNYSKQNKQKLAKGMVEYPATKSTNSKLHSNISNTFEKVDTSYKKEGKWSDPQEFFLAMESDMRMRLADITRQYKKKKRKLDEINKLNKWKRPSSEYKFANISYKNPNFICFLEKCQTTPYNFSHSEGVESKTDISTQSNRISGCLVDKYKINTRSKLTGVQQLKYKTLFANNRMPHKIQYSENESEKINSENKRKANKTTQRKSCVTRNAVKKNFSDRELILSVEHLYCKETRVLTDMGGLFYAGVLKPLQPPDVYSVTLDGERGNKSHIMSREEIFKDTILEVTPKTIDNVPTGTRLCAYWSQQYRCLYPGKAIGSENYDKTSGFVSVEFDDGDSGKIRLENIRFLLSDYPVVEYNKNPFNALGKYTKATCITSTSTPKANESQNYEELKESFVETQAEIKNHNKDSNNISKSLNQDFTSASILNEVDHKHRKHKKKRKNKKGNPKSSLKPVSDKEHKKLNECDHDTKQPNFDYRNTNEDYCLDIITSQIDAVKNSPALFQGGCSPFFNSDALPERSDKSKLREKVDAYNGKGSKIAAFLPKRQLWSWLGQAYRRVGLKGRTRKSFYKSITRGREIISVGECAVFLSTGRPDRPYIGRIEALWETSSNKVVRVRWFYHPEETTGCPILKYPGGLFVSPHEDENDVQTISHRCEVIEFSLYIAKFGTNYEQYQSVYDNNDTFYLSGYYNPRLQLLKLEPHIPIENNTCI